MHNTTNVNVSALIEYKRINESEQGQVVRVVEVGVEMTIAASSTEDMVWADEQSTWNHSSYWRVAQLSIWLRVEDSVHVSLAASAFGILYYFGFLYMSRV